MTFHLARGYVGTNKSVDQSSVKYSFGGSAMFYAGIDVAMDKHDCVVWAYDADEINALLPDKYKKELKSFIFSSLFSSFKSFFRLPFSLSISVSIIFIRFSGNSSLPNWNFYI